VLAALKKLKLLQDVTQLPPLMATQLVQLSYLTPMLAKPLRTQPTQTQTSSASLMAF
jgi:hypothetical protein